MTDIAALEQRVTRLENQITNGFEKIESLLRQEISDLKREQIEDLRNNNARLADDQRRLWDRVVEMERRENLRTGESGGSHRVLSAIGHFISAMAGGAVAWILAFFGGGNTPHHP